MARRKFSILAERGLQLLAALALLQFAVVQFDSARAPAAMDAFMESRGTKVGNDKVRSSRASATLNSDVAEPKDFDLSQAVIQPSTDTVGPIIDNDTIHVEQTDQNTYQPDMSLWSDKRKRAYTQSTKADEPTVIAALTIPAVDVKTPIYKGTTHQVLDRGAGWIRGTSSFDHSNGNVGIAAHRDGFFRGLKDIELGHEINVATPSHDLIYQVSHFEIVDPKDTHVLKPNGTNQITLVTCYPFYFIGNAPKRFIVKANLISKTAI